MPSRSHLAALATLLLLAALAGHAAAAEKARTAQGQVDEAATAAPSRSRAASLKDSIGFALVPVATTCSAACQAHGQQAIEGGTPGYQLCALVEGGINYYGTYGPGHAGVACYVSKDNQGLYFEDGFSCACADSTARLEWKPDGNCIAGSTAASSQPAACRYHKYGDSYTWWMGWIDNEMSGCHSSNVPFGPDGFLLNGVLGVGGPSYGMEVLCLSSDGVFESMTFARAPPYASAPASLRAKGTYAALSPEVAGLCGSTSQASWGKPKAVVAYLPPSERATGPTRFSTCSPGTALDHTLWLLSCPRGLITPDGSDAADAGCTCQIATPDGCDGPGLSKTLNAARGTWYYAIIQGTETTPQEDSFVFTTTKGSGDATSTCNTPAICEVPQGSLVNGQCSYPASPEGTACAGGLCDGNRNCVRQTVKSEASIYWLRVERNDCQATCRARGRVAIDGGDSGAQLCKLSFYSTSAKQSLTYTGNVLGSGQRRGCYVSGPDAAGAPTPKKSGYLCGCKDADASKQPTWVPLADAPTKCKTPAQFCTAESGCDAGEGGGATVCRVGLAGAGGQRSYSIGVAPENAAGQECFAAISAAKAARARAAKSYSMDMGADVSVLCLLES